MPTVVGYGGTAPALAPVHLNDWCPRQPIARGRPLPADMGTLPRA